MGRIWGRGGWGRERVSRGALGGREFPFTNIIPQGTAPSGWVEAEQLIYAAGEQMKEGDVDEAEESIALAKQLVDRVIDESKATVDAAAEAKELAEPPSSRSSSQPPQNRREGGARRRGGGGHTAPAAGHRQGGAAPKPHTQCDSFPRHRHHGAGAEAGRGAAAAAGRGGGGAVGGRGGRPAAAGGGGVRPAGRDPRGGRVRGRLVRDARPGERALHQGHGQDGAERQRESVQRRASGGTAPAHPLPGASAD